MRNPQTILKTFAILCSLTAALMTTSAASADGFGPDLSTDNTLGTLADPTCGNTPLAEGQREVQPQPQPDLTEVYKARSDINQDDTVNIDDVVILLSAWGNCPAWSELSCIGDINNDFMVNIDDLVILLQFWDAQPWHMIELPVEDVTLKVDPAQVAPRG